MILRKIVFLCKISFRNCMKCKNCCYKINDSMDCVHTFLASFVKKLTFTKTLKCKKNPRK